MNRPPVPKILHLRMRPAIPQILALVPLAAALAAGCTATKPNPSNPDAPSAVRPVPSPADPGTPTQSTAEILTGRIAVVNLPLRFVILDFGLRGLPGTGQTLAVYHQGQKVGEVKVSGPAIETRIAADITAGQAAVGDEVRLE